MEATTGCPIPSKELPVVFSYWWNQSEEKNDPDAVYEEYLLLFLDAYERVKTPLGANIMNNAMELVASSPMPTEASRYESPKVKTLVALCYHLQRLAGDSPFFLSVRDAGKAIGIKRNETSAAFMRALARDGLLDIVAKGHPGGTRATRYRFNFQDGNHDT